MPYKVGMVSLGCPKNQVDAEMMLAALKTAGFGLTADESQADAVVVNTCGFIEDAKREAIENILELAALKREGKLRALIVTGCLAERYREEVLREMPEIDAVAGIGANGEIAAIVADALAGKGGCRLPDKALHPLEGPRVVTTPRYTAYLRISDGCDNCCTYCTIPSIRGRFRSRSMESVVEEARALAADGAKELVVVAQDTTRYGEDLYGRLMLPALLDRLCEISGVEWIRLLYTYPDRITDELLETMARQKKVLPYLDIPLQHCSGAILRRMNRTGDRESLLGLLGKIRAALPDVTLRTTLITGFPGETQAQFEELCEFVKEARFDRLGCFAYSAEEGTPAAAMPDQVDPEIRARRSEVIMDAQLRVVEELNTQRLGQTADVLVEGYDDYIRCFYGRSAADAPEIDAKVFFTGTPGHFPAPGDIVPVEFADTIEYDLLGEQAEPCEEAGQEERA